MLSSKRKNRSKKLAEDDLYFPIRRFLSKEGCSRVVREVKFFDRSIDLYGVVWGSEEKTIAVELKLTKWQKALQQAALYQLCSDYSYVAMPKKVAESLQLGFFSAAGIGILGVDTKSKDVQVILPAILSKQAKGHYIGAYKEMFRR